MADVNVNQEQNNQEEMPKDMKTKGGRIVKRRDWKRIIIGTFAGIGGVASLAAVFMAGEKTGEHRHAKAFNTVKKAAETVMGVAPDDDEEDDFESEE